MLNSINSVFGTNSITNQMLLASALAPAIESGKLVVFYAEPNATSAKGSTNVYFIQKVADAGDQEGLDFGIIANTATRGNNAKYLRTVRSIGDLQGKQTVNMDFAKQELVLTTAGQPAFRFDLTQFSIEQVRTVGLTRDTKGELVTIGVTPVRNPNEGFLAVSGTPIFESTTVKSKRDGKPVVSSLKHTDYITEEALVIYLDSVGVDDFTKERMLRTTSRPASAFSEIGTASAAIGGNF